MISFLRSASLAGMLALLALPALAQTPSVEDLFPASIGEYTATELYSDAQPLYGNSMFSGLPTFRQGAGYTTEDGREIHVGLIIVNERFPALVGVDEHQAALGLVSFREATLEPNDGWFEASVESNMDEMVMGRAVVARPLAGHAVLIAETFTPESTSTDDLRGLLAQLDLDALSAHARAHGDVDAALWELLAAMPHTIGGHALASYHIESDGRRRPMLSINALYGDADEPAFAVVASGAGAGITNIEEILPFRPNADLTETTFGEWRALDGVIDGVGGHVVLGDLAVVGLFHLSPTSTIEERRGIVGSLDVQGIFDSAAKYRTAAKAAASARAEPDDGEPGSSGMRLVSWAHVLESDVIGAIREIDDERIVFEAGHPQLESFNLMDILLSHHEDQPFLRRIVSIEEGDGTVIVETRPASLEEAVAPD